MAFNSDTRNKLARMVAQARQLLTDEFTQQLQEIYGIQPDGAIVNVEKLTHLDDEQEGTAKFLRERIGHLVSGITTEKKPVVAAIYRVVREQAFTILNRFAALSMCEERSLVEECVRAGMQSKGFKVYETSAGSGFGDSYERYKTFLFCLFDEIAVDLGVLFDRFSSQGLLFPREQALLGLLNIINAEDLSNLWAEDETIGWIYQYFNSPEERKAMREASQTPRNSRELAVRNQFFTPRYVVEFLTDNTLGRIWYEMCRGDTSLKQECRYLVRRPNEVFLAPGEKAPTEPENEKALSQEELLKKPVHIEHRPKKDPRDLRVLDPACGSGHFLLYAFDLLERIYEEAWEDPESPKSEITGHALRKHFETLEELRRAVPKLIIENNLYGIDIDPRAVQIAALAIWLRAQKTWKSLGIKAAGRPRIAHSNIVTAEPMPGEEDMRREFTAGLKPRVLGQLVDVVFDKMKLTGEAGSLLKIEEEIKDAVALARKQWLEGPKMEQAVLFPEMVKPKPEQQQLRFDITGVTDERFWEKAEDCILDALKEYAERAENAHTIRRRLFAEDAARGFAFIDMCRKRYDVVLMNPPFGEAHQGTVDLINRSFLDWNGNLLCTFISRAGLLAPHGYTGVVYDRTANIKNTYEDFRKRYFLDPKSSLQAVLDLGWDVLDANVEVSAGVIGNTQVTTPTLTWGCDLTKVEKTEKEIVLLDTIPPAKNPLSKTVLTHLLLSLPNSVIGYYFDDFLIRIFETLPSLEKSQIKAFNGHTIKSDEYFRFWWEPDCSGLKGKHPEWARLYNGGSYSRYYSPETDVVYYGKKGTLIQNHPSTIFRNLGLQQKAGIAYGKRGEFIDAHILRECFVSTVEGQACSVDSIDHAFVGLAVLNSLVFQYGINAYCGQHKYSGYVNLFPMPTITDPHIRNAAEKCRELVATKRACSLFDETAPIFVSALGNSRDVAEFMSYISKHVSIVAALNEKINEECYRAYNLSTTEVKIIKTYGKSEPEDRIWDDEPGLPREHAVIHRVLSYYIGCILGRWDVRIAIDPSLAPKLPDPFKPLPICPPGMLIRPDGLPAESRRIVSKEWLRARPDANTLPMEGMVKNPTIPDSDFPLRISWEGILVDDTGFNGAQPHRDDIVCRAREVLGLLWKDKAHEIEQEACDILGVSDLCDYFRRPSGFFQDHLKRYSKSRRKAPIYWPLSTKSGSYTLWIYYHRLTDQTLYACVNDYVNPKLNDTSKDIVRLQEEVAKQGSTKNRQSLEKLMDFERELKDCRDEILRVAGLPYEPNLNDGVMITAAPLWKLFRHNQWRKDLEACWKKLKEGKYDWAHLANVIWPDRVKEKCKTDLSIAIAHDLEGLYDGDVTKPKRRKEIIES